MTIHLGEEAHLEAAAMFEAMLERGGDRLSLEAQALIRALREHHKEMALIARDIDAKSAESWMPDERPSK